MTLIHKPLGYLDLGKLIEDSGGRIEATIFDSGAYRIGVGSYQCEEIDPEHYRITRAGVNSDQSLIVQKRIALTGQTVAFVGLYIGDGAKAASSGGTGTISFSQREPHLANFVRAQFIQVFGPTLTFTHRVNEDALYFLTPEGRETLAHLREQMRREGLGIPSEHEILESLQDELDEVASHLRASSQRALEKYRSKKNLWTNFGHHLVEFFHTRRYMAELLGRQKEIELEASGIPLGENDQIAVNIRLPGVKGARSEGMSSRSDELDVNGMAPFRPLLLRILVDVEESIINNQTRVSVDETNTPWLTWDGPPHSFGHFKLDNQAYIRHGPSTKYVTPSGQVKRLVLRRTLDDRLAVNKRNSRKHFLVPDKIVFTPLLMLFLGLYLAEGNTSKDKIFSFFEEPTTGLAIGFTGSEGATIEICIRAMEQIFLDEQGSVETWRIKIGTKYFSEAAALGHKLGALVLRRGQKGQGAAGGLEIVEHVQDWSLKVIPALQKYQSMFDHLEYTGAGIPRVDVFYPNSAAPYLFALMRDLIAEPQILDQFGGEDS